MNSGSKTEAKAENDDFNGKAQFKTLWHFLDDFNTKYFLANDELMMSPQVFKRRKTESIQNQVKGFIFRGTTCGMFDRLVLTICCIDTCRLLQNLILYGPYKILIKLLLLENTGLPKSTMHKL